MKNRTKKPLAILIISVIVFSFIACALSGCKNFFPANFYADYSISEDELDLPDIDNRLSNTAKRLLQLFNLGKGVWECF